jgi:hypothetical protein
VGGPPEGTQPGTPETAHGGARIGLSEALAATRTGDIWLFRGTSVADRAIRLTTNSPVNHVGMAVTLDDLPPLMWHAELGRSLTDVWSGKKRRGAQLHDAREAVLTWAHRYGQQAWLRQLDATITREQEDALLRTIARLDGTPFPSMARLSSGWVRGRVHRRRSKVNGEANGEANTVHPETAFCAEIVAMSYAAMGLLPADRDPSWYDPGRFWSGDRLPLLGGARLGKEIEVIIPAAAVP